MSAAKHTKKVLITGVNGFLGRALWQYLKRQKTGLRVYGLDKTAGGGARNIVVCDLSEENKLRSILVAIRPDFIFHMAGGRMAGRKQLFASNCGSTQCLLDTLQGIRDFRPRVIIPGSAAEYGSMPQEKKVKESDAPQPLTLYGIVKLKQTNLGLAYARGGGDAVIARIFNIMGEGTPSSLAIGRFAEQIVMIENGLQEKVIYTKKLNGKRDFLDIEDVCGALWSLARYARPGEIYNVCSGYPIGMKELLRKFLSLAKVGSIAVKESKHRSSLSFDVIGSNTKLRSTARWFPKVDINRSLKNTLQSYRARFREVKAG